MATTEAAPSEEGDRKLTGAERRRLAVLGLPTFALALAITVVSTYGPTVARQFTGSATVIGVLIAGEGVGALLLPVAIGSWSDRLQTRIGGRLPFLVVGVPIAAVGLAAIGLAGSLGAMAVAVALFFLGYFVAYEPYRALYPDLMDADVASRAQSTQAVWRGAGTGAALLGGGLLLAAGRELPFALGAVVLVLVGVAFLAAVIRGGADQQEPGGDGVRETYAALGGMLRQERALRAFFVANGLWELALAALKTFVILWLTRGLGITLSGAALVVGAAALVIVGGAGVSGWLAGRYGRRRVMLVALVVFGVGLLVPLATTALGPLIACVPFVAFGGGVLLSQPYALLIPLMPSDRHGALTGFYSASRGIGVMLGPLLAGVAITLLSGPLASTQGYAATWGVCSAAILLSVPLLLRLPADGQSSTR